jgi:hypothetical protein
VLPSVGKNLNYFKISENIFYRAAICRKNANYLKILPRSQLIIEELLVVLPPTGGKILNYQNILFFHDAAI